MQKWALENNVGKGENAGNQHFLFFPQSFLHSIKERIVILSMFNLSSASTFKLVTSQILSFGKALKVHADDNLNYGSNDGICI